MKKCSVEKKIQLLEKYFFSEFHSSTNLLSKEEKTAMEIAMPLMLSKYFFSALVPNSIISPMSLINDDEFPLNNQAISVRLLKNKKTNQFFFKKIVNSNKSHSFILDLENFCNYFHPVNTLNSNQRHTHNPFCAGEENIEILDDLYFFYLTTVAKELNLICELPSINTEKYYKNLALCDDFFNRDTIIILRDIVETVFAIFKKEFSDFLFISEDTIKTDDMLNILNNSTDCSNMFKLIYEQLGMDFEHILSLMEQDSLSEQEDNLISSFYYLGFFLDKWLLTPLGAYLNLITPVYTTVYSFSAEIETIKPTLLTGYYFENDMLMPCNYFYLTNLGKEVLDLLGCDSTYLTLLNTNFNEEQIFAILKTKNTTIHSDSKTYNKTLSVRVEIIPDSDLWKIIEIPYDFKLNSLYIAICNLFGFETTNTYKFQSKNKKAATNKTIDIFHDISKISLKSINFSDNNLFLSDITFGNISFKITLESINIGEFTGVFPKLSAQSKAITLLERNYF